MRSEIWRPIFKYSKEHWSNTRYFTFVLNTFSTTNNMVGIPLTGQVFLALFVLIFCGKLARRYNCRALSVRSHQPALIMLDDILRMQDHNRATKRYRTIARSRQWTWNWRNERDLSGAVCSWCCERLGIFFMYSVLK